MAATVQSIEINFILTQSVSDAVFEFFKVVER